MEEQQKIKRKKSMPKKGQFIAIWVHNGVLWSDTLKYSDDGLLYRFSTTADDWEPCNDPEFYVATGDMFVKL